MKKYFKEEYFLKKKVEEITPDRIVTTISSAKLEFKFAICKANALPTLPLLQQQ